MSATKETRDEMTLAGCHRAEENMAGGEKILEQQTGRSAGSAVWVQMSSRVMIG